MKLKLKHVRGLLSRILGVLLACTGLSALAQTSIPIFQYAIYYNGLLEFTWCSPMTVSGRVHANGDIYTGSQWQLTFNGLVDTTGTVLSPAWDGHDVSSFTDATKYNAGYVTNSPPVMVCSGVSNLVNVPTALHEIINMPPPDEDPNSVIAAARYYNKAGIVLLVSNTSVSLIIKSSMNDSSPWTTNLTYNPTNNSGSNYSAVSNYFHFLNTSNLWPVSTNQFYDQREKAYVKLTDIDVGSLTHWLSTNANVKAKFPNTNSIYSNNTNAPNILFVADNRTCSPGQLAAVRLRNAQVIPTNLFRFGGSNVPSGFTVATPNPLYVYGNYNCPNSAYLGSTNTAAAGIYPASLISDALTILSPNWQDAQSQVSQGSKADAKSTTINAAIIAGIVYSTGNSATTFSGGVHNLPRLLEDWSSATLTLNTSLVNLFNSIWATNQFQNPTVYYQAPTRNFNFDATFLSPWKLPPGTPGVAPAPPFFVTYPASQKIPLGGQAVFSASAIGVGVLGYQWGFSPSFSGPYTDIPDATNASFVIPSLSATNAGYYQIMITNLFGNISYSASLGIASPPAITNQLIDEVIPAGGTASFAVTATGTGPLSYQWELNGTNIFGATQATLSLTNVSEADAGEYMVIVTNIAGAASNSADLSIALPPVIDLPMSNLTILAGQSVTFNVTASGTGPLTYQWNFNGTNALSATDATLELNNVTPDQAGVYSVVVTNLAGTTSNSATLSVYAGAAATLSALPSFSGSQFQFTVSGVPGFSYVIEASTNFVDWDPVMTNVSPFTLTDDEVTNFPARFYRSVYAP